MSRNRQIWANVVHFVWVRFWVLGIINKRFGFAQLANKQKTWTNHIKHTLFRSVFRHLFCFSPKLQPKPKNGPKRLVLCKVFFWKVIYCFYFLNFSLLRRSQNIQILFFWTLSFIVFCFTISVLRCLWQHKS